MIILEAVLTPIGEAGQMLRAVSGFAESMSFELCFRVEGEEAVETLWGWEEFQGLGAVVAAVRVMGVVMLVMLGLGKGFRFFVVVGPFGVVVMVVTGGGRLMLRFLGFVFFKVHVPGWKGVERCWHSHMEACVEGSERWYFEVFQAVMCGNERVQSLRRVSCRERVLFRELSSMLLGGRCGERQHRPWYGASPSLYVSAWATLVVPNVSPWSECSHLYALSRHFVGLGASFGPLSGLSATPRAQQDSTPYGISLALSHDCKSRGQASPLCATGRAANICPVILDLLHPTYMLKEAVLPKWKACGCCPSAAPPRRISHRIPMAA